MDSLWEEAGARNIVFFFPRLQWLDDGQLRTKHGCKGLAGVRRRFYKWEKFYRWKTRQLPARAGTTGRYIFLVDIGMCNLHSGQCKKQTDSGAKERLFARVHAETCRTSLRNCANVLRHLRWMLIQGGLVAKLRCTEDSSWWVFTIHNNRSATSSSSWYVKQSGGQACYWQVSSAEYTDKHAHTHHVYNCLYIIYIYISLSLFVCLSVCLFVDSSIYSIFSCWLFNFIICFHLVCFFHLGILINSFSIFLVLLVYLSIFHLFRLNIIKWVFNICIDINK